MTQQLPRAQRPTQPTARRTHARTPRRGVEHRTRRPLPGTRPGGGDLTVTRYVDGRAVEQTTAPVHSAQAAVNAALDFAAGAPERLVVLGMDRPTAEQIALLATAWDLHPLLVEDLLKAGQRPKLERYGDVLFAVTRSACYEDAAEEVVFSETHLLARGNVVAMLSRDHGTQPPWQQLRRREDPELTRLGVEAIVYAWLDEVVDGCFPVLHGLAIDKEQIERQVFDGDPGVTERIYRLSREVIDLQHAIAPLGAVLAGLRSGFRKYGTGDPLRAHLQDVADHLSRVDTEVVALREALTQILDVNATLVTQRQNEDMKKISGWAAILFAPTLIGAIYGMNFDEMPELHWAFGYPLAVGAMLALGAGLWFIFRRKGWM